MKCHICDVDKLSKEFPRENVTKDCKHPPIHCFSCVIEKLGKAVTVANAPCPYKDCDVIIPNPRLVEVVRNFKTELELLYPPIHSSLEDEYQLQLDLSSADKVVNVVMLTGDSVTFPFYPKMTVEQLKNEIEKKLKIASDKQQLTYSETVLEEYTKDGNLARLMDYSVKAFGTIQLMVLMYAIPSHFNHVIFDLYWGYPAHGCDYLDASCLTFAGKSHIGVIDYQNTTFQGTTILHSGDVMDKTRRIGHHTIEVRLKDIKPNITHLYFTLSAWNSPTIAHYPNPSLKFYEAANKSKDLCKTTFSEARNAQAVVMCSVVRHANQWKIFECGRPSAGNAKNYKQLIHTIQGLIQV